MLPTRAQQEIIDLATEDATPLFDVATIARAHLPDSPERERIDAARRFIREMLRRGYLKLYLDHFPTPNRSQRRFLELNPDEIEPALVDESNWQYHERREADQRYITIGATPAGEEALSNGDYYFRDRYRGYG